MHFPKQKTPKLTVPGPMPIWANDPIIPKPDFFFREFWGHVPDPKLPFKVTNADGFLQKVADFAEVDRYNFGMALSLQQ